MINVRATPAPRTLSCALTQLPDHTVFVLLENCTVRISIAVELMICATKRDLVKTTESVSLHQEATNVNAHLVGRAKIAPSGLIHAMVSSI